LLRCSQGIPRGIKRPKEHSEALDYNTIEIEDTTCQWNK